MHTLATSTSQRIEERILTRADQCNHATVQFGSGDYYIFCHECGAWWVRTNPGSSDKPRPDLANRGAGSSLSGEARKK